MEETPDPKPTGDEETTQPVSETLTVLGKGGRLRTAGADTVQAFDFEGSSFLTPREMRKLRNVHERFVRSLAARLSLYLRIEMDMELESLESIIMRQGLNEMEEHTHLSMISMAPLRKHSLIELPLSTALSIVDRLLGGPAKTAGPVEKLNDVEISLLDDVIGIITSEWSNLWGETTDIQPAIVTHESNPKHVRSSSLDAKAFQMIIKTRFAESEGRIRILIPHLTLEPLIGNLSGVDPEVEGTSGGALGRIPDWSDRFDHIPVRLSAWCHGAKITLKEMSGLRVGQFLPFPSAFFEKAELRMAERAAFKGTMGKLNEKWAFKITHKIEQ